MKDQIELYIDSKVGKTTGGKTAMTIRMDTPKVAAIDLLAGHLGASRTSLVDDLLTIALKTAIDAYLVTVPDNQRKAVREEYERALKPK